MQIFQKCQIQLPIVVRQVFVFGLAIVIQCNFHSRGLVMLCKLFSVIQKVLERLLNHSLIGQKAHNAHARGDQKVENLAFIRMVGAGK